MSSQLSDHAIADNQSTAKRALVVDDSRSARVILSRMLENYGVQVDTAESAEQALDYVRNAKPDVIFMDHLMPGMDGLEAVRALKTNARTRDIPVMMYTSQDTQDYLQQALMSGAAGVLSKTLASAEVSRALYQLQLLPDRREANRETGRETGHERATLESLPDYIRMAKQSTSTQGQSRIDTTRSQAQTLPSSSPERDEEWRAALHAEFEALARRIAERAPGGSAADQSVERAIDRATERRRSFWAATTVALALAAVAMCALLWRDVRNVEAQMMQVGKQLVQTASEQQRQFDGLRTVIQQSTQAAAIEMWPVPYGETPFSGARVRQVHERLLALQAARFDGVVRIENFVGDFCLSGSAVTGFALAQAEIAVRRCDMIGNPYEDGLNDTQRQAEEFTAMVSSMMRDPQHPLRIAVSFGGRKPAQAYPLQAADLAAGAWNKIAARNNRVELSLLPVTP